MKSPKVWQRRFVPAIPLPAGGELVTLGDAGRHIEQLPAAEHELAHWRNAVEALLLVVEHNGATMLARIAMMQALYRDKPEPPPPRKRVKRYRILR